MTEATDLYTVAIDAMGGDHAPAEPVAGAVQAARDGRAAVLLVGDQAAVEAELAKHDTSGLPLTLVPSEGVITEGEQPVRALRARPRASVAVAVGLVQEHRADAMISMGSTGATMAASVFALGVFDGLERPAIGGPFIGLAPNLSLIDIGSQIDCRPTQLLSFAALGATFAHVYQHIERPRVGLLSVGSEEGKGNRLVQEAYGLLRASGLNFVGNIEGHELLSDKAEVVVCDGFVGNILLKYTEGLATTIARDLAKALGPDSPAVERIGKLAAASERGGAPLFGVNGLALIGHGRALAATYVSTITLAAELRRLGLIDAMREDLTTVLSRAEAAGPPPSDAPDE